MHTFITLQTAIKSSSGVIGGMIQNVVMENAHVQEDCTMITRIHLMQLEQQAN